VIGRVTPPDLGLVAGSVAGNCPVGITRVRENVTRFVTHQIQSLLDLTARNVSPHVLYLGLQPVLIPVPYLATLLPAHPVLTSSNSSVTVVSVTFSVNVENFCKLRERKERP